MFCQRASDSSGPERVLRGSGIQVEPQAALQAHFGASKPHSKRNLEPLGRHLALQTGLRAQLGASPSATSSKLASKCNLAFLGTIFGALAVISFAVSIPGQAILKPFFQESRPRLTQPANSAMIESPQLR